jgi:acetyl esterase/lipase
LSQAKATGQSYGRGATRHWLDQLAHYCLDMIWAKLTAYRRVAPELRTPWLLRIEGPRDIRDLDRLRRADPRAAGIQAQPGVTISVVEAPRAGGSTHLLIHDPDGRPQPGGAVLWFHGGGFVSGSAYADSEFCSRLAVALNAVVIGVEVRLAPEDPWPAQLEDAHAALDYAAGDALGVDAGRIAIYGGSSGGGIAAALCQSVRDRGGPQPCAQVLRYPMIDDRTTLQNTQPHRFVWPHRGNAFGWTCLLGRKPTADDAPRYAAAARTDDLAGLPPAYISVGDQDLFHDEDVAYAERLRAAGVNVELHVEPGMYHGADMWFPDAPAMQAFRAREIEALRRALAD